MDVVVFSSKAYDREFLGAAAGRACGCAFSTRGWAPRRRCWRGAPARSAPSSTTRWMRRCWTNSPPLGIGLVALRSAGFNNVDLAAARRLGIAVGHVPAYSPDAVAEHTVAMILALNRHIHRAWARVREGNFALEGLLGFNLRGRVVGVIGTGQIGAAVCRIMLGFGCTLVAHDPSPDAALEGSACATGPCRRCWGWRIS